MRQSVERLQRPLYAFIKPFEEGLLGIRIDGEVNQYKFEKKWKCIPFVKGVADPYKGEGSKVPLEWRKIRLGVYKYKSALEKAYNRIIAHNRSCLLRELMLIIVRFQGEDTD